MTIDLTLVVTAHNESMVSGPTMTSADRAVAAAREAGIAVQTVIGLDAPAASTRAFFEQPRFDHWERRLLEEADVGRARNKLIPELAGRYVAFLDADDLFSRNWLVAGVRALDASMEQGERAIAHPELNIVFDGQRDVVLNVDPSSPLFSPHYLYFRHYYDSLCMAPREAHMEWPYTPRDVPNGLSFQDFQFTIETLAAGWRHLVVPDTIIFKRRRDFSLVTESTGRKSVVRSLPAMAIDRVRDLARRPVTE
jgi:hypothetical protein